MKLKTVLNVCFAALIFYFIVLIFCYQKFTDLETPKEKSDEEITEDIKNELMQLMNGEMVGDVKYPDIPVMVWWTPFTGDVDVQRCGKHSCFVTNERSFVRHPNLRNVFFYGTDFSPTDIPLPRDSRVDWSLFHEESPKNNPIFSHKAAIELFNHTATFRKYSDFPLTSQYLESIESIMDQKYFVSLEEKNRLIREEGFAPVVYVQSGCDTPSARDDWVKEFMQHVKVDSYGACLNNKKLPADIDGSENMEHRKFYHLLAKYKFVIAAENAVCDDYITEKLWRSLQLGSVPIYLGAPNVEDYLPNSKSAILVKNFLAPADVAAHVLSLNKDDQLYRKYIQHKLQPAGFSINPTLVDMLEQRRWGVSSEQQQEMGNMVKHFQCFVCDRVASAMKFQNIGFKSRHYKASTFHYGCPVPKNPLSHQVDKTFMYTQEWFRTKYQAEILKEFLSTGPSQVPDSEWFDGKVLDKWKKEYNLNGH